MRFRKWISILTILCLLSAMAPAALADEEVIVEAAEDLEVSFSEGPTDEDDSQDLELIFDEDEADEIPEEVGIIEPDEEFWEEESVEKTNSSPISYDENEFEIDEEGVLVSYKGFEKNVVIPNGVTEIGYDAFENDSTLESVSIPDSVTYIGSYAFARCTKLKSITIPNSVTVIGGSAFYNCDSLTSVQLSSNMTELAGDIFSSCDSLKTISIPNGITRIGSWAFAWCESLENVSIPGSVTVIDSYAFSNCYSLKNITIPNGVTSININTFQNCSKLESITLPTSVTSIDRSAFDGCDVVIRGSSGSYAEKFANGMGIPFNAPVVSFDENTIWCIDDADDHYGIVVYISQTRALKAAQKPSDLATTLTWSSSNTKVATVDQSGNVKGIAQGTTTITAATANGKGKAAQINVYVPEPTDISLNYDNTSEEVALGQTIEITARTYTPYEYETDADFPVSWTTSDKSIVSIENTSKDYEHHYIATVKGLKLGKATLTATTPDGGKATIVVEVYRPDPDEIIINHEGPIILHPGDTFALNASVTPAEADQTITWSSEDTNVATVNNAGVITAVDIGWTYINALSAKSRHDDWRIGDGIGVEVVPPDPTSIKFANSKITIGLDESLIVTPVLSPAKAESELTVSFGNDSIAGGWCNYDGTIEIYAVRKGSTTITVTTENGKTAKATVTVLAAPKKVTLNKKGTVKVAQGGTLQLKATLPKNTASALTWTSSKPQVATVDQNGKVVAKGAGTATITVKTFNKKKATVKVQVKAPVPTKVALNLSSTARDVSEGPLSLTATVTPSNAKTTLTWTSSKPKIAKVDKKTGKVTPLKAGKAVITVKTANGKTAKATITVTAKPKSVALNKKGTVSLKKGKTLQLKATLSKGSSSTLTWTSDNSKVATVSKKGKVTAKGPGTATITVKTANGLTASVVISVK